MRACVRACVSIAMPCLALDQHPRAFSASEIEGEEGEEEVVGEGGSLFLLLLLLLQVIQTLSSPFEPKLQFVFTVAVTVRLREKRRLRG